MSAIFVADGQETAPKKQQIMGKHNQYQNDDFHIGQLIKAELARQGRSITWLAAQVNCTRENMYKLFQRPWINTDLLFQIGKALNYDFFKVCSDHFQENVN